MKREDKYPETATFKYYNANPKNRKGGDCAIRAICTAMGQTWEQTVREMTELGIQNGYVVNDPSTIEKYLKSKGWEKQKQPRKGDNTKYTGSEFCKRLLPKPSKGKSVIAKIGSHHMVAVMAVGSRWKVFDIWDSSGRCIGNYWVKNS